MDPRKEKLRQRLTATHSELLALIEALAPADLTRPVTSSGWVVQDIIAHLASAEWGHQQVIRALLAGETDRVHPADEVMALSDRILVMFDGRVVAEKRPEETTTTELGLYMAGATSEA